MFGLLGGEPLGKRRHARDSTDGAAARAASDLHRLVDLATGILTHDFESAAMRLDPLTVDPGSAVGEHMDFLSALGHECPLHAKWAHQKCQLGLSGVGC
ncbi:MAG: hypothetical protein WBM40_12950 [Thiohalocapsa sp.]